MDSVCKALEQANGLITPAAQLMMMDPSNLRKFVQHHPKCLAVVIECRAKMKDFAEAQTFSLMRDRHWGALQFFLSTQCQDRGYVPPRGGQIGDQTTSVMTIDSVVIQAVETNTFVDRETMTIEHESVDGAVHANYATKKLD